MDEPNSEWTKNPTMESLLSSNLFSCPSCGQTGLVREQTGIACPRCSTLYPVLNGVVDFFFQSLENRAPDGIAGVDETFVRTLVRQIPLSDTDENIRLVREILTRLSTKSRSGHHLAEIHSIAKRFGIAEEETATTGSIPGTFRSGSKKNIDFCIQYEKHYIPTMLPPGTTIFRNVRFTNNGRFPWSSNTASPVHMSYHWYNLRNECVCWDGVRTSFPVDILPGMTLSLPLCIVTPDIPGEYLLEVCLVQEDIRWIEETKIGISVSITCSDCCSTMPIDRYQLQPDYAQDHALAAGILADYVVRRNQNPIRILEIGGGCHPQSAMLPDCSLVTLDISLPLLEIGSIFFRERGRHDILFVCADGTNPPFAPETFDGIVIFSSLHHIPEPVLFLKNLNRILKPGGFLGIFCEPVSSTMEDENLKEELRKGINEQVFSIDEYHMMFESAGFFTVSARLDGGSLKTILLK